MDEQEILEGLDWQPICAVVRPVDYFRPTGPWCWLVEEDGDTGNLATPDEVFPTPREAVASALEWSQTTNTPGCWLTVKIDPRHGPILAWVQYAAE